MRVSAARRLVAQRVVAVKSPRRRPSPTRCARWARERTSAVDNSASLSEHMTAYAHGPDLTAERGAQKWILNSTTTFWPRS